MPITTPDQTEKKLRETKERIHATEQFDAALAALNSIKPIQAYYGMSSPEGKRLLMQMADTVKNSGSMGFAAAVAMLLYQTSITKRAARLRELADMIDGEGNLPNLSEEEKQNTIKLKREARISHGTQEGNIRVRWNIQKSNFAASIVTDEEITPEEFQVTKEKFEKDYGQIEVIDERKAD